MRCLSFARMAPANRLLLMLHMGLQMRTMQWACALPESKPQHLDLAGAAAPCKEAYKHEIQTAQHNTLLSEGPHLHLRVCRSRIWHHCQQPICLGMGHLY